MPLVPPSTAPPIAATARRVLVMRRIRIRSDHENARPGLLRRHTTILEPLTIFAFGVMPNPRERVTGRERFFIVYSQVTSPAMSIR